MYVFYLTKLLSAQWLYPKELFLFMIEPSNNI